MELDKIWNPEVEIGENQVINKKSYKLAFVEGASLSNYFELVLEYKKGQVQTTQQTPQGPIQLPQEKIMWKVVGQGWS